MKVFFTYQEAVNGKFYEEIQVPEDFNLTYPFIAKEIPEGLEVPRYNWDVGEWEDDSAKEAKKRAEEAEQEKKKAIAEKELVEGQLLNALTTVTAALNNESVSQEIKDQLLGLYPIWEIGKIYKNGDIVQYEKVIYRYHAKDSTIATEQLNPKDANYLWTTFNVNSDGVMVWVMPSGYENAYKKGDIVLYEPTGKKYESLIDGNTQEPTKDEPYNRYWKEV